MKLFRINLTIFAAMISTFALLLSTSAQAKNLLTYYCPDVGGSMEGGNRTVLGSRVITLEESGVIGHLPTVASWKKFAGVCNNTPNGGRSNPRCVVRITIPGLKSLPGYAAHVARFKGQYPFLCDSCDSLAVVVEDTGGIYNRQDKNNPRVMFDLAVKKRRLCSAGAGFSTSKVNWSVVGQVDGKTRPR